MRIRRPVGPLIVVVLVTAMLAAGSGVAASGAPPPLQPQVSPVEDDFVEPCVYDRYIASAPSGPAATTPVAAIIQEGSALTQDDTAALAIVCRRLDGPTPPAEVSDDSVLEEAGEISISGVLLGPPIARNIRRHRATIYLHAELATYWRQIGVRVEIRDLSRPGNPLDSAHLVAQDPVPDTNVGDWDSDVDTDAYYAPGERLRVTISGTMGERYVTKAGQVGPPAPRSIVGTAGPSAREVLLPQRSVSFDITVPTPENEI